MQGPFLSSDVNFALASAREECLYASHQQQHDQDQHNKPKATTWAVPPAAAVSPGGQGTDEDQDQDDKKNE